VFPFVARSGRTLFAEVAKPAELELVSSTAFDGGLLALVYRQARRHWPPASLVRRMRIAIYSHASFAAGW
jgi:hypothetical protein